MKEPGLLPYIAIRGLSRSEISSSQMTLPVMDFCRRHNDQGDLLCYQVQLYQKVFFWRRENDR